MLKYQRWHDVIINRARHRTLDGYKERHHILPRSLGGDNSAGNIVNLTYREHFLVHWLLVKFTTGIANSKMNHALHRMVQVSKFKGAVIVSGWQYARARRAARDALKGKPKSAKHRENLSIARRQRAPHSAETREKQRKAAILRGFGHIYKTPEQAEKISKTLTGRKPTPTAVENMRKAQQNRAPRPIEHRRKTSESITKWWAERRRKLQDSHGEDRQTVSV